MKKFLAIGHITNDTQPYPHLGGSAAYAAVAAQRLGYESHIITKCSPQHPYIQELDNLGVQVHVLPSSLNTITTFQNFYGENGKRKQNVLEKQEKITLEDFSNFSFDFFEDAIILVSPVIGEVDTSLLPFLSKLGFLAVAAQGYLRHISKEGIVYHSSWKFSEKDLSFAQIVFLSEEDLTIDKKFDTELFNSLVKTSTIVLTKSHNGASVFKKGLAKGIDAKAFHLQASEIKDLTGAGDTFAASFLIHSKSFPLREWNSIDISGLRGSAVFANLFAAVKIMGMNGIGIDSIPTKEELDDFKAKNTERIAQFYD